MNERRWTLRRYVSAAAFAAALVGCAAEEGPPPRASGPSESQLRTMQSLAGAEPTVVAPGERAVYLDAIEAMGGGPPLAEDSPEPRTPDVEALRKVLVLAEVVGNSDPALAIRIRGWLAKRAEDFERAYTNEPVKVRAAPATSRWKQAEKAWVAWLNRSVASLTEEELSHIGQRIERRSHNGIDTFAGVDRFAFGLAVVDLWARSGRPRAVNRGHYVFDSTVCGIDFHRGRTSSRCEGHGWWYRETLATEAGTRRLAQAVLARHDSELTRIVAAATGRTPMTLAFLAGLESDAATWRDALFVISATDERSWVSGWLVPELRRAWKAYPDRRGAILYALAQASGEHADELPDGVAGFTHFAQQFEGGVGRAELTSFLDQAPRAIELLAWIMPARTRGWSVVDVLLPRLEAYFALPREVPYEVITGPGFGRIPGLLCYRDHDLGELQKLRTFFERRAPAHPGDRLNIIMDSYTPGTCRAR